MENNINQSNDKSTKKDIFLLCQAQHCQISQIPSPTLALFVSFWIETGVCPSLCWMTYLVAIAPSYTMWPYTLLSEVPLYMSMYGSDNSSFKSSHWSPKPKLGCHSWSNLVRATLGWHCRPGGQTQWPLLTQLVFYFTST